MDRHTDCERCSAPYDDEVLLCPLHKAAPDLLAALHKLEWSAESPRYGRMCPACESLQSEGEHEPDCYLVAAIAKGEARS